MSELCLPAFPQVFEEDALSWEDKLNRIMALFDVWIDVQRRWVYLEGIFTGSADIKHLLPVETQRFQRCGLQQELCGQGRAGNPPVAKTDHTRLWLTVLARSSWP